MLKSKEFVKSGTNVAGKPTSSQVNLIKYDEEKKMLRVVFWGGATYEYQDVPTEVWEQAFNSTSIGSFLAQNVKPKYSYRRVTN